MQCKANKKRKVVKGEEQMNVVVIITDSLRVDHLGCYGSHVQTPNLDALAAEGTVFLNSYAENLPTLPARRSFWTGKYYFHEAGWQPFSYSDYLLAEMLWDRGFTSALISDTYHMHKPVYNCGRGFDTVVWVRGQEYDPWITDVAVDVSRSPVHRLRHGEGRESDEIWEERFAQYLRNSTVRKKEEDYCTPRTIEEAIRWLEQVTKNQKDHLFLWVDLFDPHEPWDPPAPFDRMYTDPEYTGPDLVDPVPGDIEGYMTAEEVQHTRNLYAGEVSFVDKWIGVLLEALKDTGIYDDTLIIHTSDHGEPLGEHGYIRKARPWNYEELVHTPLIIRCPGGLGAGKRIDAMVQSVDLLPTILDIAGVTPPEEFIFTEPAQSGRSANIFPQDLPTHRLPVTFHGKSMKPLLTGEIDSLRDFAYSGHHNREWTIRDKNWSFLLPIDGSRPPELYDRREDPLEQKNVIEEYPEVAEQLELELYRFVQKLRQEKENPSS